MSLPLYTMSHGNYTMLIPLYTMFVSLYTMSHDVYTISVTVHTMSHDIHTIWDIHTILPPLSTIGHYPNKKGRLSVPFPISYEMKFY